MAPRGNLEHYATLKTYLAAHPCSSEIGDQMTDERMQLSKSSPDVLDSLMQGLYEKLVVWKTDRCPCPVMSSLEENAMFPSNISISDKCHWQRLSSQAFKSICADVIFEFERRMKDIAIENGKVKSPDNNETTPKLDVLQYYNTDTNSKVLAALKDEIKKLEARIIEMEKPVGKSSSPAKQEPKSEQAAQNPKSVSVEAAPEGIEPELAERIPDEVKKALEKERNSLQNLRAGQSEFWVSQTRITLLEDLPWGRYSEEILSLKQVAEALNESHYGLDDVKLRILEFIAKAVLLGGVPKGTIICLVGPPGVGKTSIAKAIAKALNREFYRFSVGGLSDVATIKGYQRVYIGAKPGQLVRAFLETECENPLILIDEIDKMGPGTHGDPKSALLEVLDPEQHESFFDFNLDLHLDLSSVLFVCTANELDTIPAPLLDRMEIIHTRGYTNAEKATIAKKHIEPAAKESSGLQNVDVNILPEAIDRIIERYDSEPGVRTLKKQIDKVYRKVAYKLVSEYEPQGGGDLKIPENVSVRITRRDLENYLGPPLKSSKPKSEIATGIGRLLGNN